MMSGKSESQTWRPKAKVVDALDNLYELQDSTPASHG
jgi:hypothetical protein